MENKKARSLISKKEAIGNYRLIPLVDWVEAKELHGTDLTVLNHPIIEQAFQRILKIFKPKNNKALVSLCTSRRPFSISRTWQAFIPLAELNKYDCIINSSGGIIPMEYEFEYPFLSYNAGKAHKFDEEYNQVLLRRSIKFYKKFKYKEIIFYFTMTARNRKYVGELEKALKGISKVVLLPTPEAYKEFQEGKWYGKGFSNFPLISPPCFNELKERMRGK